MRKAVTTLFALAVLGSSAGCATYESQSSACEGANASACFDAASHVWTLRASSLKPCVADESFCIKQANGASRR